MILASQSPRRIELMREAGFDVRVIPADVDETPRAGEPPFELVERLAAAKAEAVAAESAEPSELVLAADTIVAIDGEALGKPADDADARAMLRRLSGRTHQVATGVCLLRAACEGSEPGSPERPATRDVFTVVTDVTFYDLADAEIDAYVATGEPPTKRVRTVSRAPAAVCWCAASTATSITLSACHCRGRPPHALAELNQRRWFGSHITLICAKTLN